MPRPTRPKDSTKAQIGARLRALRNERGMTQAEVAELLGTHFANVSQIERGVRGLTIQQALKLCGALRVSPDGLFRDKATSQKQPLNGRLLRRFERAQDLPPEDQRALLRFLNSLLQSRGLGGVSPLRRNKKQPHAERG